MATVLLPPGEAAQLVGNIADGLARLATVDAASPAEVAEGGFLSPGDGGGLPDGPTMPWGGPFEVAAPVLSPDGWEVPPGHLPGWNQDSAAKSSLP